MKADRFDKTLWAMLAVTLIAAAVVCWEGGGTPISASGAARSDKALERELAYQARIDLLKRLYAPVESLRREGQPQTALLKLEEIERRYPQEAHGYILKAELLYGMGALPEAVANYVEALRLNGDYLDPKSPLSRRNDIERTAQEGLRVIGANARANPGNRSIGAALKNVYYLRSRLSGGCE